MKGAYSEERLSFQDPLFSDIPITYLLTTGTERRARYMHELERVRPTRDVVILHNRGFLSGLKPAWVTNTSLDIWHANRHILRTHLASPHDFVLLLEDDVEFTSDVLVPPAESITNFMRRTGCEAYALGALPFLSFGYKQMRLVSGCMAHAVVYSREGAKKAMRIAPTSVIGHDLYFLTRLTTFAPAKPMAVQRHPLTANMLTWRFIGVPVGRMSRVVYWALDSETDPSRIYNLFHACGLLGGVPAILVVVTTLAVYVCKKAKNVQLSLTT